jgi:hypothetical protein
MALGAGLIALMCAACTPDKALDFGPTGEISTPPDDELSREILTRFDGRDFVLGDNDKLAQVSIPEEKSRRRILIPFWLGINPLYPGFLRPIVGRIYVMSQSTMVRSTGATEYLIRAGSKLFKSDSIFESTHTHYADAGTMLPTIIRFVGTRVITVPKDAPATGTVTEKVPVLREVSEPMRVEIIPAGYAPFRVTGAPQAGQSPVSPPS